MAGLVDIRSSVRISVKVFMTRHVNDLILDEVTTRRNIITPGSHYKRLTLIGNRPILFPFLDATAVTTMEMHPTFRPRLDDTLGALLVGGMVTSV